MALTLMKGSEAIAEAAIRAGARYFFGYPITPQTEIPEYMSARMPEVGGCFLQAESEVAAINMIYGAAGAGARALTSSSSPGVSLKQEGISYCAGAQLPAVILNVMRGGPGLGNIQASQGDYFQAVKGGGNGDYHLLTYAPASVQEAIDIMMYAFDKAEKYRIPVLFLADGIIAQMMEPVEMPEMVDYKIDPEKKPWATIRQSAASSTPSTSIPRPCPSTTTSCRPAIVRSLPTSSSGKSTTSRVLSMSSPLSARLRVLPSLRSLSSRSRASTLVWSARSPFGRSRTTPSRRLRSSRA